MENQKENKKNEVIQVKFKRNRKCFYLNKKGIEIYIDDYIMVEAERGEDLGVVVRKCKEEDIPKSCKDIQAVIRKASMEEIAQMSEIREKEEKIFNKIKKHIKKKEMPMKLVTVESQFDGNKLTFFFTAEHRIDFRELVKELASMYRTRIEMRQIGVRDESQKIGGFGICGRPLCCSTFLQNFKPISTEMAREQHLSLNPLKISGLCGRLMCCLSYEHEIYQNALKNYPPLGAQVDLNQVSGIIMEINIFKQIMHVSGPSGETHIIKVDKLPEKEYVKLVKIAEEYHQKGFRASIDDNLPVEEGEIIQGDDEVDNQYENGNK